MTIQQAFELAIQHHKGGRLTEAEALYRQTLAGEPRHAGAAHMLGVIAQQAGRSDIAVQWIRQALVLKPDYPDALNTLGIALMSRGQLEEAATAYRRALELKPDYPDALNNLGITLMRRGHHEEAIAAYRRALELKPDFPDAFNNLGIALISRGQLEEAMAACRRALELKPNYPNAHVNLGNTLQSQGQIGEAIAAYRHALELQPDYPEAHHNLGNALQGRGRIGEAIAAYRRALELKPNYPNALSSLGAALAKQGELDHALAAFRRAINLSPDQFQAYSNLIFTLHFHPGYDAGTIALEQNRWNRQFGDPLKRFILPHANDRNPERRLRVGYVSPAFCENVVGRNVAPLIERHDRERFEVFCYSGVVQPDRMTERFRTLAAGWRSTVGVSDAQVVEMIRKDEVDILVDLSQHTGGNRLTVFARQPAPVQCSFAGYPESAGVEAIGHRISDRYLEDGSTDGAAKQTEQVFLIGSFWCYEPHEMKVEVNGLPSEGSGRLTFGNLNNFCKINEAVLRLWARVLGTVKDSRLLLLSPLGSHRERTLEMLRNEGVEPQRVEFAEHRPLREYLELYHRVDICLDTFPYNGHTTSLDAFWMGVPVVTLVGATAVGRAGLSQAMNLGLPELVGNTEEEYINVAAGLAGDLPRLAHLRSTLRRRMEASVLMDVPRFVRDIEAAYCTMWRRWCMEKQLSIP